MQKVILDNKSLEEIKNADMLHIATQTNQCMMVYSGIANHQNDAYYWKICFPHNTDAASGIYFVMQIICGGYNTGACIMTVSAYDYIGISASNPWYSGANSVQNNQLNWKVYVGNDGTHPCIIVGPGNGSYWQSCCIPWVYYHNEANSGPLTITPITNLSGINRLSQLA